MKAKKPPTTIDDYVAGFPPDVRKTLRQIRATIRKAAPAAQETIKYEIPTYTLEGNLIYFAAFKSHIGIYPAPRGDPAFKDELSKYKGGKGTVQFPLDEPIPLGLIRRMVQFRVRANRDAAKAKKAKAKKKAKKR